MKDVDYNPDPHAHPGLHVIALVEAGKGLLAILAAGGLELLGPVPLLRWLGAISARFQFDTHHGAVAWLSETINPHSVRFAAVLLLAYGVLHLVEAWGLWRARAWASWLGLVTATIYLPFDVYALFRHPGWPSIAVVSINLLVVWVLARDLAKRRHHLPA